MENRKREPGLVMPGTGELVDVVGDRYRFLATGATTDGRYALFDAIVSPGGGPPPHRHSREEEGFHVLEGEVSLYVDGRRLVAGPGTFINMPVGSVHWFRNETDQPARMLVLVVPAGMEEMFREAGTPVLDPSKPVRVPGQEERERIVEVAARYGIEIFPPGSPLPE